MPNHPRSLNIAPPELYRKMMLGRRSFPFGKVTFRGRTVKLQVGKSFCWCPMKRWKQLESLVPEQVSQCWSPMIIASQVKVRPRSLVQICLQRIAENFLRPWGWSRLGFWGSKFWAWLLVGCSELIFVEVGWTFCLKIFWVGTEMDDANFLMKSFEFFFARGSHFNFCYLKSRDTNVQKLVVLADVNFVDLPWWGDV